MCARWHRGAVVSTVTSQPESNSPAGASKLCVGIKVCAEMSLCVSLVMNWEAAKGAPCPGPVTAGIVATGSGATVYHACV